MQNTGDLMTMQGEELNALRKVLGATQQDLADGLGMSRKAVNEMEKGHTPIERRTELAVQQLHNRARRLYTAHDVTPLPGDVPLLNATIFWDRDAAESGAPVLVTDLANLDKAGPYLSNIGAGNFGWSQADDVWRLLRLLALFVELTAIEGVPAVSVHKAFSVIPEYRRALHEEFFTSGVKR